MVKDLAQILTRKIVLDSSVQRLLSSVRLHCCFWVLMKLNAMTGWEGRGKSASYIRAKRQTGLSMTPALWVHVLKSVPSHLGDVLMGILDSNSLCY